MSQSALRWNVLDTLYIVRNHWLVCFLSLNFGVVDLISFACCTSVTYTAHVPDDPGGSIMSWSPVADIFVLHFIWVKKNNSEANALLLLSPLQAFSLRFSEHPGPRSVITMAKHRIHSPQYVLHWGIWTGGTIGGTRPGNRFLEQFWVDTGKLVQKCPADTTIKLEGHSTLCVR